jgi:hypothetical protein
MGMSRVFQIRFPDEAIEDLRRLDKAAGQRILKRIQWLASNFDMVIPEPLKGDLAGSYCLKMIVAFASGSADFGITPFSVGFPVVLCLWLCGS